MTTGVVEEAVVSAQEIIRDLLGEEVQFGYEEQYDLNLVDERPLQIRSDVNLAPKKNVDAYEVQMGYSTFPPLVVTADHVLVDGHTRVQARRNRHAALGEPLIDRAIVIGLNWADTDEDTHRKIQLIGQAINNTGGERLDKEETRRMVANMLALGFGHDRIAAQAGVSKSTVRAAEKELKAASKMKALGLSAKFGKATVARAVGDAASLHDVPFTHLVNLAADAGLNATEVRELTEQASAAGSDEEALSVISARRAGEQDRIEHKAATGNGYPPVAQSLRMHLGWINNPEREVSEMIESRPALQADYLDKVRTAASRLTELARLQQEANAS